MVKLANDQLIKSILYKNADKPSTGPSRNKKSDIAKPYERPSKPQPSKSSDGAWTHDLFRNSLIDRVDSSSTAPRDLLSPSGSGRGGRQARSQGTGGRMVSDDLLARPHNSRTGSTTTTTTGKSKPQVELLDGPTRTPSRTLGGPIRPVPAARTVSSQRVNRGPREVLSGGGRPTGRPPAMDVKMMEDEPVVVTPAPTVRREMESMSINRSGGAKKEVVVRIDGLVTGTSESDVQHAFSAMFPIVSVALTTAPDPRHPQSPLRSDTISAEVVLPTRTDADNMVSTCDGRSADGNILAVYIVEPLTPVQPVSMGLKLSERMGFSSAPLSGRIEGVMMNDREGSRSGAGAGAGAGAGQARRSENRGNLLNQAMRGATGRDVQMGGQQVDLLETGGIGKMYSDTILQTDPRARVITLEEEQEARAEEVASRNRRAGGQRTGNRQERGQQAKGSLANRLTGGQGGASAGGRGQRGGMQSLASRLS